MRWRALQVTEMTNRTGLATILVVAAVVVATVPAGALPAMSAGAGTATAQEGGSNTSNASLGASISGFMQASAADTEGEVEDGMFSARFDNSAQERRADLVKNRAGTLDDRLDRLRAQRAELLNESDGEKPSVADRAKAARLTARIHALQESINTTSEAADWAGVDVALLDELRRNAAELSGQEVAELARGLAGTERGPPGLLDGERGSDADRGNGMGANESNGTNGNAPDDAPSGPNEVRGNTTDSGNDNPDDGTDDSAADGAARSDT